MENLKQLSVRIDPHTIEKLDEFVSRKRWYRRNAIINGILSAVMDNCNETAILDMVRYNRLYRKSYIDISVTKPKKDV